MPYVTSFCMFPVSAMLLYNLPICSCILSKFEWNFVTARTFFWLQFGYCLSDLISCERYRHSCRWYDGSWLFIFIEYLLKIIRSNLTLLCRVRPFFLFIKSFCGGLRCLIFLGVVILEVLQLSCGLLNFFVLFFFDYEMSFC